MLGTPKNAVRFLGTPTRPYEKRPRDTSQYHWPML
jgi:hypothetical protein